MQAQAVEQPAEAAVATGGSFNLPNSGPVPDFRYSGETTQSIEVAYAEPAKASANPVLNENIVPNTLEAQSRKIAKAAPVPAAAVDNQITNSVAKAGAETPAATGSAPDGWVIQIGATPDKDQAMTLLENAKDKGGKALRGATPFTVAFASGDGHLYRARFGGFANQDKAVNACKTLKRKGFSCWASLQ